MGRKPNALILHYFHRGPKLEDASNRYQHTCKACGEVFPKGRIDSLQNHLMRKCPALSQTERTHVILQVHNVPHSTAAVKKEQTRAAKESKASNTHSQSRTPQQTFDGLNVLAEASRQVGQVERRGSQTYPTVNGPHEDPMNMAIDPALDVFPHSFPNTFDHELGSFSQTNASHSHSLSAIPPLPHLSAEHNDDDQPSEHQMNTPPAESGDVSMSNPTENDLSTIAADANELLPPQHSQPALDEVENALSAEPTESNQNVDQAAKDTRAEPKSAEVEVLPSEAPPDSDPVQNTGIQDVSAGADQSASSNEEQPLPDQSEAVSRPADSWINFDGPNFQAFYEEMQRATQPGIRPVVVGDHQQRPLAMRGEFKAGEFGEFSLDSHPPAKTTRQKFSAERRKEVQDVRKKGACLRCRMLRKPCSLESPCSTCRGVESARLWKEPCMRVRITELFDLYAAGLHASLAYRDINLVKSQLQFEHLHGQIQATHFNDTSNAITIKSLQGRLDSAAAGLPLLGTETVLLGGQDVKLLDGDSEDVLARVTNYLQTSGSTLHEHEPSHIIRTSLAALSDMFEENSEILLEDTLQLWTATHVLCDLELQWKIVFISAVTQDQVVIDEESDPLSFSLITAHLRLSVEKRAAQLCRRVLQNFEKRLMHNKRDFDMFLVALVLLNCVERTSWLFHTWENESYATRWPLERQPQEYWSQGERFADILHMVLKMRVVPPKTGPRPDNGILMPVDQVNKDVTAWFDSVQLTVEQLQERQNAQFDPSDSRSWDLKFAAKILLPQDCHT